MSTEPRPARVSYGRALELLDQCTETIDACAEMLQCEPGDLEQRVASMMPDWSGNSANVCRLYWQHDTASNPYAFNFTLTRPKPQTAEDILAEHGITDPAVAAQILKQLGELA